MLDFLLLCVTGDWAAENTEMNNLIIQVHLPGVGDLRIKNVTTLPDPCPFPDKMLKRTLNDKVRIYILACNNENRSV